MNDWRDYPVLTRNEKETDEEWLIRNVEHYLPLTQTHVPGTMYTIGPGHNTVRTIQAVLGYLRTRNAVADPPEPSHRNRRLQVPGR